jgi:hypothetical protein
MTNLFDSSELPEQRKPLSPIAVLSENDFRRAEDDMPRIVDWRLAQALGFEEEHQLRRLIERHRERLEKFGTFVHRELKSTGGRPRHEYRLNFEQAIFIVVKSDAANADSVTIHVIQIYGMWARGELLPRDVEAAGTVIDSIAKAGETAPALIKVLGCSGQDHPFGYDPAEDDSPIIQGHDSAA